MLNQVMSQGNPNPAKMSATAHSADALVVFFMETLLLTLLLLPVLLQHLLHVLARLMLLPLLIHTTLIVAMYICKHVRPTPAAALHSLRQAPLLRPHSAVHLTQPCTHSAVHHCCDSCCQFFFGCCCCCCCCGCRVHLLALRACASLGRAHQASEPLRQVCVWVCVCVCVCVRVCMSVYE